MKLREIKLLFKEKFEFSSKQPQSGGNADVYFVKNLTNDEDVVLKILRRGKKEEEKSFDLKRKRFCIETQKVLEIQNEIDGIIPIYEYNLKDENRDEIYWYTMPVAKPIKEYVQNKDLEEIVRCIIDIADTLGELHKKDIVHRDIKPENMYFYNDRVCLGDFGLVDYPEKEDLTKTQNRIGANSTIAPEMKRNSKAADAKKADVYSLAKTLWILLTESKYGFEGTYNIEIDEINLENKFHKKHLVELNDLLVESTQYNPELRPSIIEFKNQLITYLEIYNDYFKSSYSQWAYIQRSLFRDAIPDTASWSNINDIVYVLKMISRLPSLNHMFFPEGGGMDLEDVELGTEEGTIDLLINLGWVNRVKPRKLYVENIDKDFMWSYFRLDLEEIDAISSEDICGEAEHLIEDIPGHYISGQCGRYERYENGDLLPENYKEVSRYLRGSFVFFMKPSFYNKITGTYDARHNKMNARDFRLYIENMRKCFQILPQKIFFKKYNGENSREKIKTTYSLDKQQKELAVKKAIKDYFLATDFNDYIQQDITEYKDRYLNYYISIRFESKIGSPFLVLEKNGRFKENQISYSMRLMNDSDFYLFSSIDQIKLLLKQIERDIYSKIDNNELVDEYYRSNFKETISLKRIAPPTHLFSKSELEEVLKNGDDSVGNYLVINGAGKVMLIQKNNVDITTYPVRLESFSPFNNYVGKYSCLNHLD